MTSDSEQIALYQQMILEHNRKPRNFGKLETATHQAEGFNPLCGDHFWLYLQMGEGDVVQDLRFEGSGCAISKASASLMTVALKGKKKDEALTLFHSFQNFLKKENAMTKQDLGKLFVFSGIWQYPSRVKCANLAWHAFKAALGSERIATTE